MITLFEALMIFYHCTTNMYSSPLFHVYLSDLYSHFCSMQALMIIKTRVHLRYLFRTQLLLTPVVICTGFQLTTLPIVSHVDVRLPTAPIITCAVLPLEDMVKSRESFLSIVDNMQMYAPEIGRRYICHSL